MTRNPRVRAAVTAALIGALAGWASPPAGAQVDTCPAPGPDAGRVSLTEPAAGSPVSGRVTVRGSVSSPVDVARVELFVGDARKDFAVFDPPTRSGTFVLTWDATGAPAGPVTLRVVACGGGRGPAPLARAVGSVAVDVRSAGPVSVPAPLTPVTRGTSSSPPGRGPLWVGAVVGLSGLVGLVVAGGYRPRRRRVRRPPAETPPTETPPAETPPAG